MNTHTPSKEGRVDIVVAFLVFLICIVLSLFTNATGLDFTTVVSLGQGGF